MTTARLEVAHRFIPYPKGHHLGESGACVRCGLSRAIGTHEHPRPAYIRWRRVFEGNWSVFGGGWRN